jgi:hypothetical protein
MRSFSSPSKVNQPLNDNDKKGGASITVETAQVGPLSKTEVIRRKLVDAWAIVTSLILLACALAVSYIETFIQQSAPYIARIAQISGSLLTFNGLVLSLLVAFATIYLPIMEGKKAQAADKAKEEHSRWEGKKKERQEKEQREDDLVFAILFGRLAVMGSEYRSRMLLFGLLLVVVSGLLGFILLDSYYFYLTDSLAWQAGNVLSSLYVFSLLSPGLTIGEIIIVLVFVIRDVAGSSSTWKENKRATEDYILKMTGIKVDLDQEGGVTILHVPENRNQK